MKKLILILSCLFIFSIAYSQRLHVVPYYDWSSKTAFQLSPSPVVIGYGYYSDSLSRAFDGVTFYEDAGEYYPVETWADYYYWFVNKYWYRFEDPELYNFYYHAKDDFGMAQYICGHVYMGYLYPSRIIVSFPGRSVYVNNLSRQNIRRCIRNNSWVNKNYIPDAELIAMQDKNRPKSTEVSINKARIVDRNKLPDNKRNVIAGKYNNSRTLHMNDVNNRNSNRNFYNSNEGNSRINYSTTPSTNRTSGNNGSVNRNTNSSTNTRQTSSGSGTKKR